MDQKDLSLEQKIYLYGGLLLRALGPLGMYILIPALCLSVGYLFHTDMSASDFFTYGGNFYSALGMLLTVVWFYRRSKKKGNTFFDDATLYLDQFVAKKAACFLVFGFCFATLISAVLTLLPAWGIVTSYATSSQMMYKSTDVFFNVITVVLTAPLAEEIVFRGYMMNTLLQRYNEKAAVLIVSAVFAVCHGSLLWILYAFVAGILLCQLSLREDNILYGLFLHMGFNFFSAVVMIINLTPAWYQLFFSSNLLIALYGLLGLAICLLLAKKYFEA